jgi:DNA-3-methyladenine glycosylase II
MSELLRARRHLARRDAVMKKVIAGVGPCTLTPFPDRFLTLVGSIVSQQISTKAAATIRGRVQQALGEITPAALTAATDEQLRGAGLSAGKLKALRDLAQRVHGGQLRLDDIHDCTDDEVVARLIPVHGIGRWTAQMFLIFGLGRWDVLPTADMGLRAGVKRHYGLEELPDAAKLEVLAVPWKPYRSIATWYIWRSLGPVPGDGKE